MDSPDPEEEFEKMLAEEMEMAIENEAEYFEPPNTDFPAPKSRKSLDFGSAELCPALPNSLSQTPVFHIESKEKATSSSVDTCLDWVQPLDLNHKRTVQDLFGDIDDIDFDPLHDLKRPKRTIPELTEFENQLEMINKILKMRKELIKVKMEPKIVAGDRPEKKLEERMSRTVPKWPFMPVSVASGRRIYLRMYTEEYVDNEIRNIAAVTKKGGLLTVPYSQLFKLATEELRKKAEKPSEGTTESVTTDTLRTFNRDGLLGDLWVERYKPRNYFQLLSNEGTNRLLLQWLKLWDKLVFNQEKRSRIKDRPQPTDGANSKTDTNSNAKFSRYPQLTEELDEYHRPLQYKVALLCGPPGLGKTTLAHMIARQAGYNVVEVNASDDRSPEVFRVQLEAATQMRAVMGQERRPNCLVLDEIDGAPLASIEVLVKFATDKDVSRGKRGQKMVASRSCNGGKGVLKRPIICICNDVYIPALRPLRQIAFTLHFPPISTSRLAERLMQVCFMEFIKSDLGTMMALAEKTGNDIRSCLQTLQYLRVSSGGGGNEDARVSLMQVKKIRLGSKDSQQGLFTVWQKIFQRDDVKPSQASYVKSELSAKSMITGVVRAAHSCGEFERLVQGVHENFLNIKFRDLGMRSVSSGMNWFCIYDLISTAIQSTQDYVLYPYLPYAFGAWHELFSVRSWPKLSFPSTGYQISQRSTRTGEQIELALLGMEPMVRRCTRREDLIVDKIPYLMELVVPDIRPISSHLYTPEERQQLRRVVNAMVDYNLIYTQERTQEGSFVYNMDPNLEEIGRFKGLEPNRKTVDYGGRQMLTREVEAEKFRRVTRALYTSDTKEAGKVSDRSTDTNISKDSRTSAKKKDDDSQTPNLMLKLTPKALKKKTPMEARDFFGRIVESNLSEVEAKAKMDEIVKSTVWFHFKEGYNNAVRKNILMDQLF